MPIPKWLRALLTTSVAICPSCEFRHPAIRTQNASSQETKKLFGPQSIGDKSSYRSNPRFSANKRRKFVQSPGFSNYLVSDSLCNHVRCNRQSFRCASPIRNGGFLLQLWAVRHIAPSRAPKCDGHLRECMEARQLASVQNAPFPIACSCGWHWDARRSAIRVHRVYDSQAIMSCQNSVAGF